MTGESSGRDAVLVARVREGDRVAFGALYHAHVGAVSKVVRDNVADRETQAELVQEVFTRALERLATLREPERFRPWLLSIARHVATDQHRWQGRQPPGRAPRLDAEMAVDGPGPSDLAELADLARLVQGCAGGLSTRDVTALNLVTHLGFAPAEVAAALGVSVGAAKVIVHRARRRLHDAIALELLVRRRAPGCPTFEALREGEGAIEAARHIRDCAGCEELALVEVSLYQVGPASPVPDRQGLAAAVTGPGPPPGPGRPEGR